MVALRKWDSSSASYKDEVVTGDSKKEAQKDVAYVFRRVVYETYWRESRAYSELEIESPALVELIKSEIDNKYPGVNFEGDTIYMQAPFAAIVLLSSLRLLFYHIVTNVLIDTQLGQASKASPARPRIPALERPCSPTRSDQDGGRAGRLFQDEGG